MNTTLIQTHTTVLPYLSSTTNGQIFLATAK